MRRLLPVIVFTVFALVACKGGDAGGAPSKGVDDAKYYTMEVTPLTLAKGAAGVLRVVVKPKEGLHWNDEFPAKFSVANAETDLVRFAKTEVKKGDPEIASGGGATTLSLPVAAKEAGEGTLDAILSFSLCTETTCHIFRGRDVRASVSVN